MEKFKLRKEQSIFNKIDHRNPDSKEAFKNQADIVTAIKMEIVNNYGISELTTAMIGKKRTDGRFKQLNSKGNGYGNM